MKQFGKKSLFIILFTLGLTLSCSSLSELSFTQTPTPSQTPVHLGFSDFRLTFDGIDDWVVIGDSEKLEFGSGDFTISARFKTNRQGVQQQIIRKGYDHITIGEGRWVLSIDASGVIRIVLNDTEYPYNLESLGTTTVTDGRWHHVAAVFDRDESLRVYLDGQLEIQDSSLPLFNCSIHNTSNVNIYIGRANSSGMYFEGMLDDISLWRGTRTQEEIQGDRARELPGQEEDLIAYWNMQEGQGQTIFDRASNNHGQLGSTQGEDNNDPSWYSPE